MILIQLTTSLQLQALPSDALSAVLNIAFKEAATSALQTLDKRLSHNISTNRLSMRMVTRDKVSIRLRLTQCLPSIRSISAMIDVESVRTKCSSNALTVIDKAATAVRKSTALPGVIGRGTANDDLCTFGDERLAGLDQVEGIRVYGCRDTVVCGLASLGSGTGAY